MDVALDSIPGTWSERRQKKYAPISVCIYPNSCNLRGLNVFIYFQAREYVMERFAATKCLERMCDIIKRNIRQ
jgi:hypothetical protein